MMLKESQRVIGERKEFREQNATLVILIPAG